MHTPSRSHKSSWPLVIFLLLPPITRAETAVQAWVQRYNGPGSGNSAARAVAVDGSNNVIVTGTSAGSGGIYDYATIKYSSAGMPLWTNRYDGPGSGSDTAAAVAVDGNNDVIVTGTSTDSGGRGDYATLKYSSAGVPLWTNRYHGPGNNYVIAGPMAVDGSNNVIVTGTSAGTDGRYDWATIKYSSAGAPLWTNRYELPENNDAEANAVAVDGSNNVIVTGTSAGTGGNDDYATIKYSSAGMPLWTNRYDGPGGGTDYPRAVAVDGNNNVIVTGYSVGSGGNHDYATLKYSSEGLPLWTNRYNGLGNGDDYAFRVAVDGSNNVIVTGQSNGSAGNHEYATIKYSSDGEPLWTNRYGLPENNDAGANSVAVDGGNNVIVTGYSTDKEVDLAWTTIKYSSAGLPLWTNRYNGPGNVRDEASAVVVDHSGNVIVTGYSASTDVFPYNYEFATVKYIRGSWPVLTGLQPTNGTFPMRVDGVLQPGALVIEASTDLAGWAPVFTNTTPTNVLYYADPDAGTGSSRFYRAFQFP